MDGPGASRGRLFFWAVPMGGRILPLRL